MSVCHGSVAQPGVRPATPRVLVTELSGPGHINPTPASKPCEDSTDTAAELYLSAEKLESLCVSRDFSHTTSLDICVDTQGNTLGNFGAYFPKLVKLKMNNSMIFSVRDLGTALSHLQVLWMSRCSLQDLDGIPSLFSLKELYLAYNNVSNLSHLSMLESLQLLDLEGNDVDDLVQVQYLGLCGKLRMLTMEGNPVCTRPNIKAVQTADYSYRASVRELVPQLSYLDDVRVEEDGRSCGEATGEDWAILRSSIRDCNPSLATATEDEEAADIAFPYSRPGSSRRPASSHSCVLPFSSAAYRLYTDPRPVSACGPRVLTPPRSLPGPIDPGLATLDTESSTLTHGAGKIVFCGNPVQAIRARREKIRMAPPRSTFAPLQLPIHMPEQMYDFDELDVRKRVDVFAELRAWREQHSRRLQDIKPEKLPQVLACQHSDEEELYDEDNGEAYFSALRNGSNGEGKHGDSKDTVSADSSFHSLSPEPYPTEASSPDTTGPSQPQDPSLPPTPPLRAKVASAYRKLPGIRARQLRLSHTDPSPDSDTIGVGKNSGDTNHNLQCLQVLTRTDVPLRPPPAHKPRPPSTSVLGKGLVNLCTEMGLSSHRRLGTPQMFKLVDRPAITRPHTASATLQKHL